MAPAVRAKGRRSRRSERAEENETAVNPGLDSDCPAPYAGRTFHGQCPRQENSDREDERDILQLVKLYLEKEGFRTVTATSGAEGLNSAKQNKPI